MTLNLSISQTDETIEAKKALLLEDLSDLDELLSQMHDRITQVLARGEYLSDDEISELVTNLIRDKNSGEDHYVRAGSEFEITDEDHVDDYRKSILAAADLLPGRIEDASFSFLSPALQKMIHHLGYTLSQGVNKDSMSEDIIHVFLTSFFSMYVFKYHTKIWDVLDGYDFEGKERLLNKKNEIQNRTFSEGNMEQLALYYGELCYHAIQKQTGSSRLWNSLSEEEQDQILGNIILQLDRQGEFSLFFRQLIEGLDYSRDALRHILSDYQLKKTGITLEADEKRKYTKLLRDFRDKVNTVPTLVVPDKFSFISPTPGSLDIFMNPSDTGVASDLHLGDIALIVDILGYFLVFEQTYNEIPIRFRQFSVDNTGSSTHQVRPKVSIVTKNQPFLAKAQTRLKTIASGIRDNPTKADLRRFHEELNEMRSKMNDILAECIAHNHQIETNLRSISQFIETLQFCLETISNLSEYQKVEKKSENEDISPPSGEYTPEQVAMLDSKQREHYISLLRECGKLADTSTKDNVSIGDADSKADGSVSNAIGKFLYVFRGMIERNEVLLDGYFSWSQVYHLWMEQHDISGRRDKMARSVLRSMIEKSDEQIVGIHSPAAFSVAFPKLYDIIKYYADERTQKEEKNKRWCQLYLPKLQNFISENFPEQ